jgi:hypothetical protein
MKISSRGYVFIAGVVLTVAFWGVVLNQIIKG